jgi:hypothetical protein
MPTVQETIPSALATEAEAARAWFARDKSTEFKLTGIVDPPGDRAEGSNNGVRELQLILCGSRDGQDVCLRERFEVKPGSDGFDVTHLHDLGVGSSLASPAPLLDPPLGVRSGWLDTAERTGWGALRQRTAFESALRS